MSEMIERLLNEETMSDCPLRESMELRKEAASSLRSYEERVEELESLFDLRWEADRRAIKIWQEVTGRENIWPDHTDLCVFLMMALDLETKNKDAAESQLSQAREALEEIQQATFTGPKTDNLSLRKAILEIRGIARSALREDSNV